MYKILEVPEVAGILDTLKSLFYSLAKEVPIGKLNQALVDTLPHSGTKYSDKALAAWAEQYATAIVLNKLPFNNLELHRRSETTPFSAVPIAKETKVEEKQKGTASVQDTPRICGTCKYVEKLWHEVPCSSCKPLCLGSAQATRSNWVDVNS